MEVGQVVLAAFPHAGGIVLRLHLRLSGRFLPCSECLDVIFDDIHCKSVQGYASQDKH